MKNDSSDPLSLIKLCTLCNKKISTSNNTTNARTHLQKHHARIFEKAAAGISDIESSSETESSVSSQSCTNGKRSSVAKAAVTAVSIVMM